MFRVLKYFIKGRPEIEVHDMVAPLQLILVLISELQVNVIEELINVR